MTRPIPASLQTIIAQPVTRPGYFIELHFDPILRLSTRNTLTWGGYQWAASVVEYAEGRLSVPTGDLVLTQLLLAQGTVDRRVVVYMYYVADDDNPPLNDNVDLVFDGFMDGATSLFERIDLPLYARSGAGLFAPRVVVRAENGFSVLPAPGLVLVWNGITIKLPPKAL